MSATPIDQIPEPVVEAMKRTANDGVPCGCRWDLAFTGVYLCNYHDGMVDGYHLAQETAKEADR